MCQVEHWMAIAHLAHINQHQLIVLYHHILGLKVKMQQTMTSGNSIENLQQKVNLLLREIATDMLHLTTFVLQTIRYTTVGRHLNMVHLQEEVGIFTCQLIQSLRVLLQTGTQGLSVQQFVHQSILTTHLHHIERDGRWHTHDKGFFRHGNLFAHLVHGGPFTKDLDNGVIIEAEDGSHAAYADDLAPVNTQLAQGSFNTHYLGEASHVKHVVDFRIDFNNSELLKALCQHQQDAKTRT